MRNQTNTTMSAAQCHYFALWIKRPSCIKTHNVITDNFKEIRPEYQLLDSTSERRLQMLQLSQKYNVRIKSSARNDHRSPDTSWKTATPLTHSCSNEDVTQLDPLGFDSDAMFEVVEISDACFVPSLAVCSTRCSQPHLNLANLEATVAQINFGVSFFRNSTVVQAFWWRQLTLSLRSVVQVVVVHFIIFQLS